MYQLKPRLKKFKAYQPIIGNFNIRLDANESYFQLPTEAIQEIIENSGALNRYPDPYAIELTKSFSQFYNIPSELVTVGNGSDELIALILSTFFDKNEKLLLMEQDFSMYQIYSKLYQVSQIIIKKNNDLTINVQDVIDQANQQQVSALLFSNPCNPTSLVLNRQSVIKIVESVNALVIVDEAYMDFSTESVLDLCDKYPNLIVLKTCSKAIGLAGIRIGFAISNVEITAVLKAIKSPYNVNILSQNIAFNLLKDVNYIKRCTDELLKNTQYLYQSITHLAKNHASLEEVYPTSTNFIYIKSRNSQFIFEQLLNQSVVIRHMNEYLRISTGTKEENNQVVVALANILADLEERK